MVRVLLLYCGVLHNFAIAPALLQRPEEMAATPWTSLRRIFPSGFMIIGPVLHQVRWAACICAHSIVSLGASSMAQQLQAPL